MKNLQTITWETKRKIRLTCLITHAIEPGKGLTICGRSAVGKAVAPNAGQKVDCTHCISLSSRSEYRKNTEVRPARKAENDMGGRDKIKRQPESMYAKHTSRREMTSAEVEAAIERFVAGGGTIELQSPSVDDPRNRVYPCNPISGTPRVGGM